MERAKATTGPALRGCSGQPVGGHLNQRLSLKFREVRETLLDLMDPLSELLACSSGETLGGKLEHEEMTAPAGPREDRVDPFIVGVVPDARPGCVREDRPRC